MIAASGRVARVLLVAREGVMFSSGNCSSFEHDTPQDRVGTKLLSKFFYLISAASDRAVCAVL